MSVKHTLEGRCGECGVRLQVRTHAAEKAVRCPKCNAAVMVSSAPPRLNGGVPAPEPLPRARPAPIPTRPSRQAAPARPTRPRTDDSDRNPSARSLAVWLVAAVAGVIVVLAAGAGVWFLTRHPASAGVNSAAGGPPPTIPAAVEPDRYAGEWTGPETDDHRVDGIIISQNEFPCTGAVRMGKANVTTTTPVLWTQTGDELVGTDNRSEQTVGPVLARVRLAGGLLSGEAQTPAGALALFVPPGMKAFAGFKRTGPPPAPEPPPPAPPKPPPTPAELIDPRRDVGVRESRHLPPGDRDRHRGDRHPGRHVPGGGREVAGTGAH